MVFTPPEEHILSVPECLDKERAAGKIRGPLHGIPIIVKVGYMRFTSPEPHRF
jgi:Asp-tRNA(Asn)/Glu-tRNA(Gln) amidotransferase A subunit family amidase